MKKISSTLLIFFISAATIFAQSDGGTITGQVLNEEGNSLPQASVAVYDSTESNIITGVTSDSSGTFTVDVSPGSYVLEISFLSYDTYNESVGVASGETVDVGSISLTPTSETMDEVFVRAEQSQMEMSFDRRVFRVGEDLTSMGGSAMEVLDRVPSLSTDIDGNLSLRGNQSVRILINGKPSNRVSDGNVDNMRSIPASMIKEVEIITNPSSKYSAEGSAGIINIILKKEQKRGWNGSVSAGGGLPQEYEGSTNLNYRVNDVNFFFNGGLDYRTEPESGSSFQRFSGDTTYMYRERNEANEAELDGDLQFGADFYLSENEVLTASAYISAEEEENNEDVTYTDLEYSPGAFTGEVLEETFRENRQVENETDLDFNLDYENKFSGDEHKLVADASFDISRETANNNIRETVREGTADPLFQRTTDGEEEMDLRFNAEYTRPLGENGKLEAGIRSDTEWMDNTFSVEERQNGNWVDLDETFNQNFLYLENVNAAFAILGTEWGDFSGQVGLRLENTRIRTEVKNLEDQTSTNQVNDQNYLNLFPSVFLNYSFNEQQSVQVSYSRRLSRPWSRSLIPFVDFDDPRSQFTGNPNLRPEFSNSYEAGYLHHWQTGSLLTSFYYRHRTDVIERITLQDQENQEVTRIFPINLATEESWGIELSADQKIANSLTLSGNANLFRSNSDGSYQGQVFSSEAEIFQSRMSVRWDIAKGWKYEASMRYRGPRETTQGRRAGMTMIDTGFSREFMDGRAVLSLNVRDLLDTQNFNNTVTTDGNPDTDFYSEREFSWSSRSATINFQYFFGENNEQRRGGGDRGGDY